MRITAIIPALDEEQAIGRVVADLWAGNGVTDVIVCDNGSTDRTAEMARRAGARIVFAPQRGYGAACLAGLCTIEHEAALAPDSAPDIIVFIDGDYSDFPADLPALLAPLIDGHADFVVGSRVRGMPEIGALTVPQRFGNWLAVTLLRLIFRVQYTDLGPFRAIRWPALQALKMRDENFGWTVEMQIKAALHRLRAVEVPVRYRKRIGQSKISGTIKGTIAAGTIILTTIARYAGSRRRRFRAAMPTMMPSAQPLTISAVIPALNEAATITECVRTIRAAGDDIEIIVCDGGSTDATIESTQALGNVRLIRAPRGRAAQMNAGASVATGDVVWFVHADSRVAPESATAIRRALCSAATVGGAFRFSLGPDDSERDSDGRARWRIEFGTRLRVEFLHLPYGDQGFFVRRDVFFAVGGFPVQPILEDVVFQRRLRRIGGFVTLSTPLVTSARRWRQLGWWRTTLINWGIMLLAGCGVPLKTLATLYGRPESVRVRPLPWRFLRSIAVPSK